MHEISLLGVEDFLKRLRSLAAPCRMCQEEAIGSDAPRMTQDEFWHDKMQARRNERTGVSRMATCVTDCTRGWRSGSRETYRGTVA